MDNFQDLNLRTVLNNLIKCLENNLTEKLMIIKNFKIIKHKTTKGIIKTLKKKINNIKKVNILLRLNRVNWNITL